MSFKQFLEETQEKKQTETDNEQMINIIKFSDLDENLLEHQTYKPILGTNQSYREDSANSNTKTQQHVHIYAKLKGKGCELYSVNIDGTGHDGNRGKIISQKHANYFKGKGYQNNILENKKLDIDQIFILLN